MIPQELSIIWRPSHIDLTTFSNFSTTHPLSGKNADHDRVAKSPPFLKEKLFFGSTTLF